MIRPEHPFDIRPDLRKAASTKAESVIRLKQLVRVMEYVSHRHMDLFLSIGRSTIHVI